MPDWTSNHIDISGEPADIRAFLEAIKWEDKLFDFNRIIPMPECLKRTVYGHTIIEGKEVRSWIEDKDAEGNAVARCFTPEEEQEFQQIGYCNWYDWSRDNWGTQWNACNTKVDDGLIKHGLAEILFDTAWSAPIPILKKMVRMFPKLSFKCRWRDEDDSPYPHSLRDIT
jgi:hypothetical protein